MWSHFAAAIAPLLITAISGFWGRMSSVEKVRRLAVVEVARGRRL
jgi:hypothetical protein